jgi:hypothetical protein
MGKTPFEQSYGKELEFILREIMPEFDKSDLEWRVPEILGKQRR